MAFDATAHAAALAAAHPPFTFDWNGSSFEVPSGSILPTATLRSMIAASAAASSGDAGAALQVLDQLAGAWPEDAITALMEMPTATAIAVAGAWMDGVSPDEESGKSPSPSPRTTRSGRR